MKKRKNKKPKAPKQVLGVGWYRADQWDLLLKHSADRDDLEATYGGWLEIAHKGMENLAGSGVQLEKIPIDVGELIQWCRENDRPVDGESRAEFIALKTKEKFSK